MAFVEQVRAEAEPARGPTFVEHPTKMLDTNRSVWKAGPCKVLFFGLLPGC
jgi:hypothetical protein